MSVRQVTTQSIPYIWVFDNTSFSVAVYAIKYLSQVYTKWTEASVSPLLPKQACFEYIQKVPNTHIYQHGACPQARCCTVYPNCFRARLYLLCAFNISDQFQNLQWARDIAQFLRKPSVSLDRCDAVKRKKKKKWYSHLRVISIYSVTPLHPYMVLVLESESPVLFPLVTYDYFLEFWKFRISSHPFLLFRLFRLFRLL